MKTEPFSALFSYFVGYADFTTGLDISPFLISTTATRTVISALGRYKIGRTELLSWKCHMAEECAGVILLGGYTFLVGDTIFGGINDILSASDYSYYRENAQGDGKISAVSVRKRSVDR